MPRELRYFEDLAAGAEFISPGRTVTEADVVLYAGLSGDFTPLHTDAEYMKGTAFGERIAHGVLGIALASGLGNRALGENVAVIAFLGLEWKFLAPIRIGDTVTLRVVLQDKRESKKPDRGVVGFRNELLNQRGEKVQEGLKTILVQRRPAQ